MAIYFIRNFSRFKKFIITIEIIIIFLFLNVLTGIYNSIDILSSIQLSLKLSSPILFFLVIIVHWENYSFDIEKLALNTVKLCVFLSIVALLFFHPTANRGDQRFLPIYFESIHTHSYILVSIFSILGYLLYLRKKYVLLIFFLITSLLFLTFGYAVRTAVLVYLFYCGVMLYNLHPIFKHLWVKGIVYGPLIILGGLILSTNFSLDEYSSGRLSMYSEKVDQIKTFNLAEVFLGQGQGSDLIRSKIWAYEDKGAHSDIITYFIENGLIFLFFYFCLILFLLFHKKNQSSIYLFLILGYFISSMISNGITTRPLAGYVFFISLAYIYLPSGYKSSNCE